MVAGQVGEHPGGEPQPVEPPLVEAVRRGLHGHPVYAALHQRGQRRLQVDRSGRGERAGGGEHGSPLPSNAPSVPMLPEVPVGVEQMADQAGGGGLSVGAGDADQREPARRMTEPGRAEHQRRAAAVAHHDLRHAGRLPAPRRPPPRRRGGPRPARSGGRRPESRAPRRTPLPGTTARLSALSAGGRGPLLRRRHEQIGAPQLGEQVGPGERHRSRSPAHCGPHRHRGTGWCRLSRLRSRPHDPPHSLKAHAEPPPVQGERGFANRPSRHARHGHRLRPLGRCLDRARRRP